MPWAFNDFEPGIWHECPLYFHDLFGVEVQTVARNFDYDTLYLACNWGGYSAGDAIKLLGSGIDEYLKVEAKTAEVIGVFEDRMPAVLRNRYGKGAALRIGLLQQILRQILFLH